MIYIHLFFAFFKVGMLGFGGGLAMLPLIYQTVREFGFMSTEEFSNLVALSQITPGPIAANTATYVGFMVGGIGGGLAATLGVSIPSFIMVISSMKVMEKMRDSKIFKSILYGVRPAAAGLIGAAAVFIGGPCLINKDILTKGMGDIVSQGVYSEKVMFDIGKLLIENVYLFPLVICIASLIMASKLNVGTVKIILIMMVIGLLGSLVGV